MSFVMGSNRDYYADLEISPTAEVSEIKKQYRKLGMISYYLVGLDDALWNMRYM